MYDDGSSNETHYALLKIFYTYVKSLHIAKLSDMRIRKNWSPGPINYTSMTYLFRQDFLCLQKRKCLSKIIINV